MHSRGLLPTQITPSILDCVYGLALNVHQPACSQDGTEGSRAWGLNTNPEPYGSNFSRSLKYKTIVKPV